MCDVGATFNSGHTFTCRRRCTQPDQSSTLKRMGLIEAVYIFNEHKYSKPHHLLTAENPRRTQTLTLAQQCHRYPHIHRAPAACHHRPLITPRASRAQTIMHLPDINKPADAALLDDPRWPAVPQSLLHRYRALGRAGVLAPCCGRPRRVSGRATVGE